jgi:isoleucyl-tRNA synthetase
VSSDTFSHGYWELIAQVKTAVNKVLEAKRSSGEVGGSLGAEVTLYCDETLGLELQKLANELRFVLITSTAEIKPLAEAQAAEQSELPGLWVQVKKSVQPKCARCWHHRADVGAHADHPEICLRCLENVAGAGEIRRFA